MFHLVAGELRAGNGVCLAREAEDCVIKAETVQVYGVNQVLAQVIVSGKPFNLSEISVGGTTENQIDVVIAGKVVHTMFYTPYGMNHKSFAAMLDAYSGQYIQVISRKAIAGTHTVTMTFHRGYRLS